MKDELRTILALAAALALGGCAWQSQAFPPGDPIVMAGAEATIRPGDRVALQIWNEPEMSDTFTVAADGTVILPKLGAVSVTGKAAGALQDSLRLAFAHYLRNPSVEVTALRRIGVVGEVKQPGVVLADLTMTLPDVIVHAGGLTDAGDEDDVVVLREGERLRFSNRQGLRFAVAELRSGDQVIVGRQNIFERDPLGATSTVLGLVGFVVGVILPQL